MVLLDIIRLIDTDGVYPQASISVRESQTSKGRMKIWRHFVKLFIYEDRLNNFGVSPTIGECLKVWVLVKGHRGNFAYDKVMPSTTDD